MTGGIRDVLMGVALIAAAVALAYLLVPLGMQLMR